MQRRHFITGLLLIATFVFPSSANAQFWCDWFPSLCDEPDTPKQVVVLEIDQMAGTTPLELDQTINGEVASLSGIYDAADIEVDVRFDKMDLAREESLSLADLHALMSEHQSVAAADGAWKIYALVVTEDEDKPGTLGIMFDFGPIDENNVPREAFAVFETPHTSLAGGKKPEMLLTTTHEMAHAFNIHHADWEGTAFQNDSTVEGYSMTDTVRWHLSAKTIAHIKDHDRALVVPSQAQNFPFGLVTQAHLDQHEFDPPESFDVIDSARTASASRGVMLDDQTRASLVRSRQDTSIVGPGEHALKLGISVPKTEYALGEPVVLDVTLENTGSTAQPVRGQLNPDFGLLVISVKQPGASTFREFRSPILRNGRAASPGPLEPGQAIATEAKIFFDANGWNFTQPGTYKIRADFPLAGKARLKSPEIELEVAAPPADPTDAASRGTGYLSRGGQLGRDEGVFLVLGGGAHLEGAKANLERLVAEAPDAPQAPAARLALAQEALRPTIDPKTLEKPAPDVDRASALLQDVEKGSVSDVSRLRAQNELVVQYRVVGRNDDAEDVVREIEQEHRVMIEKAPSYQREFQLLKRNPDADRLREIDRRSLERGLPQRDTLEPIE